MAPEKKQAARERGLKFVMDTAERFISWSAVMAAIIGFLWYFAKNEVQSGAQDFVGTTAILEQQVEIVETVTAHGQQIEELSTQVSGLVPIPRIVEYDSLRSFLDGPCTIGEECKGQIRFRRTPFGRGCSVPVVAGRWFVDSHGRKFSATRPGVHTPQRGNGDWLTVEVDFIAPLLAAVGVGEYFFENDYQCMLDTDGDPTTPPVKMPMTEFTDPLEVEIVHGEMP